MYRDDITAPLTQSYSKASRAYALDYVATIFLFVAASIMTGRIWRFPFDDELIALTSIDRHMTMGQTLYYYLHAGDIHPPLSFLFFHFLDDLGLGTEAMRLCSLAMMAVSLALMHSLTMAIVTHPTQAVVRPHTRLIAILLFGLIPMAVSVGDAIRWYPMFAFFFSLFVTLYLAGSSAPIRLSSAVALGFAACVNFLAILVVLPFFVYRYFLERQFRLRFEIAYWSVVLVFASPGIWSAYSVATHRLAAAKGTEFHHSTFSALATTVLGFFGGDALGVSQAWIILPALVLTLFAAVSLIDRKARGNPIHLLLLMFAAMLLMVLPGFAKPRSFLYLAPVVVVIQTIFLNDQARMKNVGRSLLLVALLLGAPVGAIASINHGSKPFKRNSVAPYQEVVDFIHDNEKGRVLVVTTDAVLAWILNKDSSLGKRCISRFFVKDNCEVAKWPYDTIFVVSGYSDKSEKFPFMEDYRKKLSAVLAGRRKVAHAGFGSDEDAALKSKLAHVSLEKYVLSADLYQ